MVATLEDYLPEKGGFQVHANIYYKNYIAIILLCNLLGCSQSCLAEISERVIEIVPPQSLKDDFVRAAPLSVTLVKDDKNWILSVKNIYTSPLAITKEIISREMVFLNGHGDEIFRGASGVFAEPEKTDHIILNPSESFRISIANNFSPPALAKKVEFEFSIGCFWSKSNSYMMLQLPIVEDL